MNPDKFISDYSNALHSQDWENVEPLIHSNACVTFSTGKVHKGIQSIKEAYQKNFALIKSEQYLMSDVHWIVKEEHVAVYIFNFTWRGIINGQQAHGSGRGTAALMPEQGKWKLIAEHLGPDK
jgi:ketosteroid isomerase-like protein